MRFTQKVVKYVEEHPYVVLWTLIILFILIFTILIAVIIIVVIIYAKERENQINKLEELKQIEKDIPEQLEKDIAIAKELGLYRPVLPKSDIPVVIKKTNIKLNHNTYKSDINDIMNIITDKSLKLNSKKVKFSFKIGKYKFMKEFQKYYEYNTHFYNLFITILADASYIYTDINIPYNPAKIKNFLETIEEYMKKFAQKGEMFINDYPILEDIISELTIKLLRLKIPHLAKGYIVSYIEGKMKGKTNYFLELLKQI